MARKRKRKPRVPRPTYKPEDIALVAECQAAFFAAAFERAGVDPVAATREEVVDVKLRAMEALFR